MTLNFVTKMFIELPFEDFFKWAKENWLVDPELGWNDTLKGFHNQYDINVDGFIYTVTGRRAYSSLHFGVVELNIDHNKSLYQNSDCVIKITQECYDWEEDEMVIKDGSLLNGV